MISVKGDIVTLSPAKGGDKGKANELIKVYDEMSKKYLTH